MCDLDLNDDVIFDLTFFVLFKCVESIGDRCILVVRIFIGYAMDITEFILAGTQGCFIPEVVLIVSVSLSTPVGIMLIASCCASCCCSDSTSCRRVLFILFKLHRFANACLLITALFTSNLCHAFDNPSTTGDYVALVLDIVAIFDLILGFLEITNSLLRSCGCLKS